MKRVRPRLGFRGPNVVQNMLVVYACVKCRAAVANFKVMVYIGNRMTVAYFQSLQCALGFICLARSSIMKYQCTEKGR